MDLSLTYQIDVIEILNGRLTLKVEHNVSDAKFGQQRHCSE